jgi:hypothetical protein
MNTWSYLKICKELIHADLLVFKQTFFDKFIDVTIWVVLTIIVTGYIMPYFGLSSDFGVFQFGGIIAAIGLFELYGSVVELVSDFQGDRVINYNLILPIPSWMAIVSKGAYYFIIYVILSVLMLPIGKLTLWNQLDLTQIDYFKFFISLFFQNIFYACFVLWAASIVENASKLGSIWARYIFPMWFMGGFQFSWIALHNAMPVVSYIILLNPMMYITEATRASVLGQSDYINFWICLVAIAIFSALCLAVGMRNLQKRLDFV